MKRWVVFSLVVCSTAWAQQDVLKAFSDQGSLFVRTPTANAVSVGDELSMVSDAQGTKEVGKAVVMEVTGPLARLSLDEASAKAKAKFVRVAAAKKPPAPAPEPKPVVAVAPAAAPPPRVAAGPSLVGRAEKGALRLTVYNDSATPWSDCELKVADGRSYRMEGVAAHADDGVMWVKFSGPPRAPEPPYDNVLVRCDEGETRFFFANPTSPGALKGYVENAGGGRVIVHNASDLAWSRCDVRKPDGSHYVLGSLKAKDQESIRSGLFAKEAVAEIPITSVHVSCKQGEAEFPLK